MNTHLPMRMLAVAAVVAGVLGASTSAFAGPPPPVGPPRATPAQAVTPAAPVPTHATIELTCVKASTNGTGIDPEIASLAPHLKWLPQYTRFRFIDRHDAELTVNQDSSFDIEGGRRAKVSLLGLDRDNAKMRIQMFKRDGTPLIDTTITVKRNRTFYIAGPQLDDGVLILPVSVEY